MAQALPRPHPRLTAGARPQRGPLIKRGKKGPSPLSEVPYAHNNSQIRTQISALFHAYQLGLIKNVACRHTHTHPHLLPHPEAVSEYGASCYNQNCQIKCN